MAGREASLSDSLLRVEEVCDLLRVGPTFVYRHAAELGGVKVGRHLRFRQRDIDAWLDDSRVEDRNEVWRAALSEAGPGRKSLSVPPDNRVAGARIRERVQARNTRR